MTCRYCKQPGHLVKECPDKPPMVCDNCGQDGHLKNNCENARKINRDHVADMPADTAWAKLVKAVAERDMDDTKEAVQEYIKAVGDAMTYRELQEALFAQDIKLFLIPIERPLVGVFTNMDLQGNMGKKYSITYRFSETPARPREAESFPENRDVLLDRLNDAGEVVDSGRSLCHNCGELGHISKTCPQERVEKPERPKIACSNCGADGHRLRDCPQPRVDKFACKNCGKSGHKAAECEEPPNLDNVECHKCNQTGHFARDCPDAGPRGCRNCGQEGHIAKECDQPRSMDNVICRNCEKPGHMSRDCPLPRDWSKVQCSNCQMYGHTKVRCTQLPADSEEFDGGFPAPSGDAPEPVLEQGAGGGDASQSFSGGGW
ncbi:hypothetical protein CDD83_9697 [Cordyceps sp. RAO-2017]|nr:hypothetical protein CDD83_9697 [Cordyceps sp. RAO-2017]